jgi:serine phosphatase RsbU (regulator of sigma subunit)/DNA-binding response OmpR family regulator/anti-sigma regulatory factor (Ser/Thr protein kinase)
MPTQAPEIAPASSSILLVDDDENSLRALLAVLEPLGQRLVAARSGEDALRRLLREDFAVILLDMRMPGLDGLETAGYINARTRTRHIPIIFLTAHAQDVEQVMHAYAKGAVDYVVKPFDPDVLRSKVAVFVQLQRERAERVREARARAQAEAVASTVSKLQSVSDAALTHLEIEELLPEIVERARAVFEADAAGLLLSDESTGEVRAVTSQSLTLAWQAGGAAPDGALIDVLLSGSSLRSDDLREQGSLPAVFTAAGLRSLIAAPLASGTRPLGVLFLGSRDAGRFNDDDVTVLTLSADRAAIAIEHARSYERERGLAEALQRRLLPDRLPEAPGLAMAARYLPSERAANVGGDWYDVIALSRQRTGLAIGDVVGHGVGAATLMGELRSALRAYAVAEPVSPARALGRLNSLVSSTHGGMVATLLYMVLEVDGSRARFSSAGHPPPLLMTADGSAHFLEYAFAAPLGAVQHARFNDFESDLAAGSTMLLYTDGLVERRGQPIDAGLEQLREALRSAPADLEQLCSHVLARAPAGAGTQDDVALLAVRRVQERAERLEMVLPAEPESVPIARNRFKRWLVGTGAAAQEDTFDITLALNEACTNTVQHAYGPERGHTFRVCAERSSDGVLLEVQDSGRWRAPRGSDGGRGLGIIERVMDEVDVERSASGTTLRMRRKRGMEG